MRNLDLLYVHDMAASRTASTTTITGPPSRAAGKAVSQPCRSSGQPETSKGFGLGVNEWEVIRDALEEADLDCCMLAGRYSLLDRDAAETFLPLAQGRAVTLVLAGVFNSGSLTKPRDGRRKFNYADAEPVVVARVEALRLVRDDHGGPLAAAATRSPICHPTVTCVVIGAKTAAQLAQNIAWSDADLPEALWSDLDAVLAGPPA